MLELPETITIAKQINDNISGKRIAHVLPPTKAHKFCWYAGNPAEYDSGMSGSIVQSAESFGIYVEVILDNGKRLCFNDGVNVRFINCEEIPKNYQLLIEFDDGMALVFTVAMYGSIILHDGIYDNEYYLKSKMSISPFSSEFEAYYRRLLAESKASLSAKAFLATGQRFPGIGNGVLQDILFMARIHPKRKIGTLSNQEQDGLLSSICPVLHDMTEKGGRDTEKDIFGQKGGYRVKMSKNTYPLGCPQCKEQLVKDTYMGGTVYYCPGCQPLEKY